MIEITGGVQQRGQQVFALQVGKIGQQVVFALACPQQAEKIADPNPYAPDAESAAALERVDSDALR